MWSWLCCEALVAERIPVYGQHVVWKRVTERAPHFLYWSYLFSVVKKEVSGVGGAVKCFFFFKLVKQWKTDLEVTQLFLPFFFFLSFKKSSYCVNLPCLLQIVFCFYLIVKTDNITAPGDVVDKVKIERENESTVVFTEGARNAYIGYITIKVKPAAVFVFYLITMTVIMYTQTQTHTHACTHAQTHILYFGQCRG